MQSANYPLYRCASELLQVRKGFVVQVCLCRPSSTQNSVSIVFVFHVYVHSAHNQSDDRYGNYECIAFTVLCKHSCAPSCTPKHWTHSLRRSRKQSNLIFVLTVKKKKNQAHLTGYKTVSFENKIPYFMLYNRSTIC